MESIFNLKELRTNLNSEDWEDDECNNQQVRRIFLGTVFNLLPSGKYYQPFACSNVDPCPYCQGRCVVPGHSSARIRKRNQKRYENMLRLGVKLGREYAIRHAKARNAAHNRWQTTCPVCHGVGSKEAYQDECWYEQAEEELSSIGCSLESGEGDPCDIFVVEYRDISEKEEDAA